MIYRKVVFKIIFVIIMMTAVMAGIISLVSSINNTQIPVSKETPTSREEKVDFSLPLYTKRAALVCPLNVVYDIREGHGLQGAIDAHLSVFGHEEAVEKSGCQEWREGLLVSLTTDGQKQAADWNAEKKCGMADFSDGLIFSCDLRNTSEIEQAKPSASVGTASETPSKSVAQLIAQEEKLNDICRNGSRDDNATQEVCVARDDLLQQLQAQNWCWGHDGQIGAERTWEPCQNKK